MDALKKLNDHLRQRPRELMGLKKQGVKVVAYAAGGFTPPELIRAAGAVPICLAEGGDPEAVTESMAYTPIYLCTYCRSQIAYYTLGQNVYYRMPDMYVIPIPDANVLLVADSFSYYTDLKIMRYGVPHDKRPIDAGYFKHGIENLVKALEELTGNKIDDEALKAEIIKENRKRSLLKEISYLRVDSDPVLTSKEYVALHHASFYADIDLYLECLEEIAAELKVKKAEKPAEITKPRIMLIASTLAYGDPRIDEIVERTDAEVVYEEVAEGMVPYFNNVELEGDLIDNIVDAYFTKRIRGPWDRPWGDRYDNLVEKAKEFKCDIVLWYQTLYRDGPDLQSWTYGRQFKDDGFVFVKIETNYNAAEKGPMRTRIETAVEMLNQ